MSGTKNIKTGESISIQFPDRSTMGYVWQVKGEVKEGLSIKKEAVKADAQKKGGTQEVTFTIEGRKKGSYEVSFVQLRSWEKDARPVEEEHFTFVVSE
jgi:predicted secreted protein